MKVTVSLFNSKTKDVAIVIDLLRASTTITIALNTFNKVITVNTSNEAFELKNKYNALLAGEDNLKTIEGFDITNSPKEVQKHEGDVLVLKTTNGTRVLENTKNNNKNVTVLIGTGINANAVAKKALEIATEEIEIVMAGRHEKFNIEDATGAGVIVKEIIKSAKDQNIPLELDETALASTILAKDEKQVKELIGNSWGATKLTKLGLEDDVKLCQLINEINEVPIYKNNEITKL